MCLRNTLFQVLSAMGLKIASWQNSCACSLSSNLSLFCDMSSVSSFILVLVFRELLKPPSSYFWMIFSRSYSLWLCGVSGGVQRLGGWCLGRSWWSCSGVILLFGGFSMFSSWCWCCCRGCHFICCWWCCFCCSWHCCCWWRSTAENSITITTGSDFHELIQVAQSVFPNLCYCSSKMHAAKAHKTFQKKY